MLQMFITMGVTIKDIGAVVTTITTILVWCKCKRQHRWSDISITNMNTSTGPVQVFQTCMHVGASLTNMTTG